MKKIDSHYFFAFLILCVFILISNYCYEYPKPIDGYFSQKGQDKFLNEELLKGKRKGFFVEIGAHDGISFSNTYFFEKYLEWKGICIEPNPDIFKQLISYRHCHCEQVCITDVTGQMPYLKCAGYMLEMYSGLLDNYDPRHLERIDREMALYGGSKETILVNCITLNDLCQKYNASCIDLLSIDVEGAEEAIIKAIDFDKITIEIITIENNFNEDKIKDFLLSKGYCYVARIGKDDIYQKGYVDE